MSLQCIQPGHLLHCALQYLMSHLHPSELELGIGLQIGWFETMSNVEVCVTPLPWEAPVTFNKSCNLCLAIAQAGGIC